MEQITLKLPVTIKAKVTEDLKKRLAADLQETVRKIDMELQQIDFQAKRIMAEQAKIDPQGLVAIRQQVDAEKQKRLDAKNQYLERIKEAAQLEIGAEIAQGQVEGIFTLKPGDSLHAVMGTEILLDDGKIIAIRA